MICYVIYGVNSNDFGWFMWKFFIILADFLLLVSVSLKQIRIRLTKMRRIQRKPDPYPEFRKLDPYPELRKPDPYPEFWKLDPYPEIEIFRFWNLENCIWVQLKKFRIRIQLKIVRIHNTVYRIVHCPKKLFSKSCTFVDSFINIRFIYIYL